MVCTTFSQKTGECQKVVEIKTHEKCEHKSREQTPGDDEGDSSGGIGVGDLEGLDPAGSAGTGAEAGTGAGTGAGADAGAAAGTGTGTGTGAGAEKAELSGASPGAEVKAQPPPEKTLAAARPRRDSRSVLRVSQLLLGAIASHKRLTVAALRRELGQAGYQVRRRCRRRGGGARAAGFPGTLIRVSGSHTSGYLRVWKPPKPKRKPGRPKSKESVRPCRTPSGLRSPRRRRRVRCRKAARRAREVWRRDARVSSVLRRLRPRVRGQVRPKAKDTRAKDIRAKDAKAKDTRAKDARAKVMDRSRGKAVKENRSRSRGRRPREEKKLDPEKPAKRPRQRSASLRTGPRAARTRCCT
ncbi:testis-specific H1 histone [Pipistrellus kuhlii]|uniref:testis-specific H1 histone n=1 Tax=Pipistrellus kuhlii TaxID=59472 RepID=UPI001E26FC31|nr:testis-specific H1 histone [Pipistrellus kuhlii]